MKTIFKENKILIFLSLIFSLSLLLITGSAGAYSSYPTSASCDALPGVMGDINRDGLINEYDEDALRLIASGNDDYNPCADFSNPPDNVIAGSDISGITQLIADINNSKYAPPAEIDDYSFYNFRFQQCQQVFGDVNGDGKGNLQDYQIVKQMAVSDIPFHPCGDLDHDGAVGPSDFSIAADVENGSVGQYVWLDPPVIYLDAGLSVITETVNHEVNTVYTDAGAYAADNQDDDTVLTGNIVSASNVDDTQLGTYTVKYNVTDSDGNPAVEAVRTVVVEDTTAPVITLIGDASVRVKRNTTYVDQGATANDNYDDTAVITSAINIDDSAVDTSTNGTYTVTFNVQDSSGNNAAEVIRTVEVYSSSGGGGGSYTDRTPPTNISLEINNDNETTTERDVILSLSANGADYIMISNSEDFSDSSWQDYEEEADWKLAEGEGVKTVYIKFKDNNNNISEVISDAITLVMEEDEENQEIIPQVLGEKVIDQRALQLQQIYDDAHYVWEGQVNKLLTYMGKSRDTDAEQNAAEKYVSLLTGDVALASSGLEQYNLNAITNFIAYGTKTTLVLGEGERTGVLNSYKSAFGRLPETEEEWRDAIKIANGRWPSERSQAAEDRANINFEIVYQREADMDNPHDNAAVTTMAYGLRPLPRNLDSEKAAIKIFEDIYGYSPLKATAWDVVRAIAYSGAIR